MADAHRRLDETTVQLQLQSAGTVSSPGSSWSGDEVELLLARSAEPQAFSWAEPDLAQRLAEYEEPEPEADLLSLPDPEPEPEPEREDLAPAGQERTADARYSDDPEESSSADPVEPPQSTDQPVEQERPPARPMPRWRRY